MAALPTNLTARLWIDYVASTGGAQHTFMVRYDPAVTTLTSTMSAVESLLDFISGALANGWRIQGARKADPGSDFSLPVELSTGLAAVQGTGGVLPAQYLPRETRLVGRSQTTGRRVSLSLYGYRPDTPANFRWGPGEVSITNSAVFSLLNAAPGIFLAVDGTKATFYPYANVQYNSYWEGRARVS